MFSLCDQRERIWLCNVFICNRMRFSLSFVNHQASKGIYVMFGEACFFSLFASIWYYWRYVDDNQRKKNLLMIFQLPPCYFHHHHYVVVSNNYIDIHVCEAMKWFFLSFSLSLINDSCCWYYRCVWIDSKISFPMNSCSFVLSEIVYLMMTFSSRALRKTSWEWSNSICRYSSNEQHIGTSSCVVIWR